MAQPAQRVPAQLAPVLFAQARQRESTPLAAGLLAPKLGRESKLGLGLGPKPGPKPGLEPEPGLEPAQGLAPLWALARGKALQWALAPERESAQAASVRLALAEDSLLCGVFS